MNSDSLLKVGSTLLASGQRLLSGLFGAAYSPVGILKKARKVSRPGICLADNVLGRTIEKHTTNDQE